MQELELKTIISICQPDELSAEEQHLLNLAIAATNTSYAPYSQFRVGAAVRLDNGVEISGSNQENVSYPQGLCAERTAIFYAGAQYPEVGINTLAIAARGTDGELLAEPVSPCGGCRQVVIEAETRAKHPITILLYGRDKTYRINGIKSLMPLSFTEF